MNEKSQAPKDSTRWHLCVLALFFVIAFSGCTHLFYHPDRYLYYPPKKFGYSPQEIAFESEGGRKIIGWWFLARGGHPKGTIVQFHGNGENLSSHYLSLVWATLRGYNLFVFDYQGYGKSEGEPTQKGTYLDGLAALNKAWQLHANATTSSSSTQFVIYGQSLGGAIAMRSLADFEHRKKVDLIVMDSTFVSYKDVARRRLASHWVTWAFSPLGMLLISDEYSAEDALKISTTPLLVIHDKRDPAVPYGAGQEIFELATSAKEFWPTDRGDHIAFFAEDRLANRDKFIAFLEKSKK